MTQESAFSEFKAFLDKCGHSLSTDDMTDLLTRIIPECEERLFDDDDCEPEDDDDDIDDDDTD